MICNTEIKLNKNWDRVDFTCGNKENLDVSTYFGREGLCKIFVSKFLKTLKSNYQLYSTQSVETEDYLCFFL